MFDNSKFNGDISNWKPFSLEKNSKMFYNCSAPKPYWHGLSKEERIQAIQSIELNEKLSRKIRKKRE